MTDLSHLRLRGFTVVEVVVSLALVSLTLLVGQQGLHAYRSGERPKASARSVDLDGLREDIRAALRDGGELPSASPYSLNVTPVMAYPDLYEVTLVDKSGPLLEHSTSLIFVAP